MRRPFRFIAHAVAVAALAVCAAAPAADTDTETAAPELEPDNAPTAESMSLDLFLVRPVSLVATVLGTAVFIVSTPFCALAWNCADPGRRLVVEPFKYTFARDLGDLD